MSDLHRTEVVETRGPVQRVERTALTGQDPTLEQLDGMRADGRPTRFARFWITGVKLTLSWWEDAE